MSVFENINESHLTDDLMMIYEVCGIETVRILLRYFGGMTFYIPKLSRLDSFILGYIKENREAKSFKIMAQELNVSETFIRSLDKKIRDRAKYLKE